MNQSVVPAITVILAHLTAPREVQRVELQVPLGSTVRDALARAGFDAPDEDMVGVWGRKMGFDHILREGDRIELYRPLRVDARQARRERFSGQGAGRAGLFARRRPGAKPGY